MGTQDILTIIAILLAVISIIVAIFTQSIREWIVGIFRKIIQFIQNQANQFWFRALILLTIYLSVIALLYYKNIFAIDFSLALLLIFIFLLAGLYLILKPLRIELSLMKAENSRTKQQLDAINRVRQSELESIQKKWKEFVDALSNAPGYEIVGAFLTMSKPISLENDVLIIGLPEVVLKASKGIDLEIVTPLVKHHLGREYLLRPAVYEPESNPNIM